jgi:saccharopine dehydrogenase-like NADP-dependent oxidoreductase
MHHDIQATFDDGSVEAVHSNLKLCGDTKMSAMCKTVGYTTAIGAEMILNNKISQKGLITPLEFSDVLCNEVLHLLQEEGIQFEETLLLEEFASFPLPDVQIERDFKYRK